ncbi:MAG: Asp-tRNA(Asn)/Glu-tRNA(Gln) amidotransferase subunit GatC [Patescibacteria group bacterium]
MNRKVISTEEVEYIAKLSNLSLSKSEIEEFSKLLTDTLSYIDVLEELDTSNIAGTYQVTGLTNVFQTDNNATLTHEEALFNANKEINGMFVTDAVFDR